MVKDREGGGDASSLISSCLLMAFISYVGRGMPGSRCRVPSRLCPTPGGSMFLRLFQWTTSSLVRSTASVNCATRIAEGTS